MNKEDIEYYTFQYTIPVYKIKPPRKFCEYYQTHKDEMIVELDKENKQLKDYINQLETNWNELKKELNTFLEMGGFNSYGITCALGCIHKIEDRCSNE